MAMVMVSALLERQSAALPLSDTPPRLIAVFTLLAPIRLSAALRWLAWAAPATAPMPSSPWPSARLAKPVAAFAGRGQHFIAACQRGAPTTDHLPSANRLTATR